MKHPLLQLTLAHIKEYLREPGAMFWSFGFPILMALGLGLAFSGKKEIVHGVAVVPSYNMSDSLISNTLLNGMDLNDTIIEKKFKSDYSNTKYIFHITSWNNASLLMKRGQVSSIITIINDTITFHSDPLNPEAELIGIQLDKYFKTGNPGSFEGKLEPLNAKGLRYIDFLIPGLLGMGIMMSVMWGICYSLIEKRSKKLLRRMVATPMRKSHFLLSHWASRIMMMAFETLILLLFSKYFFKIEIQGSIFALILLLLAGNFCFFGLSILLSARTSNMQLGNGLISIITTPMMVVSGIFFSYQNFPPWAIKVIKIFPLTQLVDGIRSVINEGAGMFEILNSILILSLSGLICFTIGMRIYKWY
jgi:ABC-type multidrug transport system permease subunit